MTPRKLYGDDQYDYRTQKEARAGLTRLVKAALRRHDDAERRYTIEKLV
jgi:hypothetical protein